MMWCITSDLGGDLNAPMDLTHCTAHYDRKAIDPEFDRKLNAAMHEDEKRPDGKNGEMQFGRTG